MKEIWKVIEEFPGYSASTKGRIRNDKTGNIKSVNSLDTKGYPICQFRIKDKNKSITKKIHRYIAITFIPNPNNYPQVNHKDGVKRNNNVENLEWCTNSQNNKHCRLLGLNPEFGENHHRAKLTEEKVKKIRKLRKEGFMPSEICKMFNVKACTIVNVCNFRYWKHVKES